jgi:hypothetical protein
MGTLASAKSKDEAAITARPGAPTMPSNTPTAPNPLPRGTNPPKNKPALADVGLVGGLRPALDAFLRALVRLRAPEAEPREDGAWILHDASTS